MSFSARSEPPLPATMRAVVMRRVGGAEVLCVEHVETPRPAPGQVVLHVEAAAVHRVDLEVRAGTGPSAVSLPHVPGVEAAGRVAALGAGVSGFAIGERVLPSPGFPRDASEHDVRPVATARSFALTGVDVWGSYAQYMRVSAAFLVREMTGLEPAEVATLPLSLAAAVHAVKTVGGVGAGQRVVIQAGGSDVGTVQVQVAKALGACVAATVRSEDQRERARAAGADFAVDTRCSVLAEVVGTWTQGLGADVVIDNPGGSTLAQSIGSVRARGTVVVQDMGAPDEAAFDVRSVVAHQKRLVGSMAGDPEDLAWGLDQVCLGRVRPAPGRSFPLERAADAHRYAEQAFLPGRAVLLPWESPAPATLDPEPRSTSR